MSVRFWKTGKQWICLPVFCLMTLVLQANDTTYVKDLKLPEPKWEIRFSIGANNQTSYIIQPSSKIRGDRPAPLFCGGVSLLHSQGVLFSEMEVFMHSSGMRLRIMLPQSVSQLDFWLHLKHQAYFRYSLRQGLRLRYGKYFAEPYIGVSLMQRVGKREQENGSYAFTEYRQNDTLMFNISWQSYRNPAILPMMNMGGRIGISKVRYSWSLGAEYYAGAGEWDRVLFRFSERKNGSQVSSQDEILMLRPNALCLSLSVGWRF